MVETHAWNLLLVVALLAAGIPAVTADGPAKPASDPVLVVDASTGQAHGLPEPTGEPATVRVEGVQPSTDGFDLVGPQGELFVNQSSRSDGVVEFWNVPLTVGTHRVEAPGTDRNGSTVATFEVPGQTPPTGTTTCSWWEWWCGGCSEDGRYEKVADAILWTPLLLVNSPSGGAAEATSTWRDTESVYVAGAGWESHTKHSTKIEARDGHSRGYFQLAEWGIYTRNADCGEGHARNAKVIDWSPNGRVSTKSFDLTGDSRFTDADNPTSVSWDGYDSVEFDTRFHGPDREHSGPSKHYVRDREIVAFQGEVSAGSHRVTFDIVQFKVTNEDEAVSYAYDFQARSGHWHIHEISDSPGWSFCRPAKASNCPGGG